MLLRPAVHQSQEQSCLFLVQSASFDFLSLKFCPRKQSSVLNLLLVRKMMMLFNVSFQQLIVLMPTFFVSHTFHPYTLIHVSFRVSQRETRFARHSRAVLHAPCSLWRQPVSAKGLFLKDIFLPQLLIPPILALQYHCS